ncbi:MAG TPA: hypothetical protein VNB28_04700 [Methylomirabilota bacterium]|nr:hypothetical protein [Methylomirabilota bacterium]
MAQIGATSFQLKVLSLASAVKVPQTMTMGTNKGQSLAKKKEVGRQKPSKVEQGANL